MKKSTKKRIPVSDAVLSDACGILELQRIAYQSEAELCADWSIPPLTQTLRELEDDFAQMTFLKAVADGVLVGSVR